jgi:uncharacterized metal-binding protein YceD (DUF177 family)
MESDFFVLYIERLKEASSYVLQKSTSPAFLDIHEPDLLFEDLVQIELKAYLSSDHLILHLSAKTKALLPCSICNASSSIFIQVEQFAHAEPLHKVAHGTFDFSPLLREAILLEVPSYAECQGGLCPKRTTIESFLISQQTKQETYLPFAHLEHHYQENTHHGRPT